MYHEYYLKLNSEKSGIRSKLGSSVEKTIFLEEIPSSQTILKLNVLVYRDHDYPIDSWRCEVTLRGFGSL